jgi:hypothetical protein
MSVFESVADGVDQVRRHLTRYGDSHVSSRLAELAERLRSGDNSAVVAVVGEATGGMGSLRDRYISPANGDRIAPDEVEAATRRLDELVETMEREARAAADKHRIALIR